MSKSRCNLTKDPYLTHVWPGQRSISIVVWMKLIKRIRTNQIHSYKPWVRSRRERARSSLVKNPLSWNPRMVLPLHLDQVSKTMLRLFTSRKVAHSVTWVEKKCAFTKQLNATTSSMTILIPFHRKREITPSIYSWDWCLPSKLMNLKILISWSTTFLKLLQHKIVPENLTKVRLLNLGSSMISSPVLRVLLTEN